MSTKNQINVSTENGYLKIVNSTAGNEEYYKLSSITTVQKEYFNFTALNTYSPGKKEYDEVFNVVIRMSDGITDDYFKFDIRNVDNQSTWTVNTAGLEQAVDDIKGWVSGSVMEEVTVANLNFATAAATTNTDILFSSDEPWSMQFIWSGLTGVLNGTIDVLASNDGSNFDSMAVFSTINLTSASGSSSIEKNDFPFKYVRIKVVKGTITAGTLITKFRK